MKANAGSKAEYSGKVLIWLAQDSPQDQVIQNWLDDIKARGGKMAPAIKEVLYKHIMQPEQANLSEQFERLRGDVLRAIQSGAVVRGGGNEPSPEDAADLVNSLMNMQT